MSVIYYDLLRSGHYGHFKNLNEPTKTFSISILLFGSLSSSSSSSSLLVKNSWQWYQATTYSPLSLASTTHQQSTPTHKEPTAQG